MRLFVSNRCIRLFVLNSFIRLFVLKSYIWLAITYLRLRWLCVYRIRLFVSNFNYSYQMFRSFVSKYSFIRPVSQLEVF